jgi:hypothetical protein
MSFHKRDGISERDYLVSLAVKEMYGVRSTSYPGWIKVLT